MTTLGPTQQTLPNFLAWLEALRQRGQVHYDDKQQCWHVLGHPETSAVLSDPVTFSSDLSSLAPVQEDLALFQRGNFVGMDPPRHRKLRGLVNQAFTPRMVAGLAPRITELTDELLDGAGEDNRLDLVADLAYPLPVIVIAEMLGIPSSDRPVFRRWADALFTQDVDPEQSLAEVNQEAVTAIAPVLREMNAYLLAHIRARRADPAEDLTSRLVQAEVDGQRLDDEEIVGFVGLLLLAGHVTTTATLGNAVVCFEEDPDAVRRIRADPELLPAAIEEVLRYRTPFPRLGRRATVETRFAGVTIPAESIVVPWLTAANRDVRVFTDPDRFDIRRTPNPHLSFGHGIHFCIGAPLARLEAKIALRALLERYSDIAVARDTPVEERNPWVMISPTRVVLEVVRA